MTTSRASLDGGDNGPRGRGRVPRGPGFSGEEVKFLFKTVETLLPGSMEEWDGLARVYNARFPLATRSGESLRRKFLKLGRADYAERARRIKVLIQKRLRKEAGFQLPEDLEEEEEEGEEGAGYEQHNQADGGNSGTDSDAHASRSDTRAEGEERTQEENDADEVTERTPIGRRTSSVSSDEPGNANEIDHGDQDRESGSDTRSAVVDAVTSSTGATPGVVFDSGTSDEGRPAERDSDAPQLPTAPLSAQVVYRPPPTSTPALPTRPMPHYPLPSDQHRHPERPLSFPPQRPPRPVAAGHYQCDGYRESAEVQPPSSASTGLSSPMVVNRWFELEERRLLMEEQRMAFEQRRLTVEERRLQLLEQKMEADAAERNRLLDVLQIAIKNSGGTSRNAES